MVVDLGSGRVSLEGWATVTELAVQVDGGPMGGPDADDERALVAALAVAGIGRTGPDGDALPPTRGPEGPGRRTRRPPTGTSSTPGGTRGSPACSPTPAPRDGSMTMVPSGPTSSGGMSDAVLVCGVDGRPDLLPAVGRRRRGGRLRLDGRARQPLLPGGVGLDLSVQPGRDPRVPRRQAVPRAVLADPGHGGGDRAAALRHLRAQAADAPPADRGQAGHVGGRADRQPARPRRGRQPVARGLRAGRTCRGRVAGPPHGRGHRHRAGPVGRRLLRVPRRVLRHPIGEDEPGPRPSRCRSWSGATPPRRCGGPPGATAGSTAGATRPTSRACWPSSDSSARRRARPTGRSRST